MIRHVLQTALPLVDIEVLVTEPSVSIAASTAPSTFRHVVIQVDVDSLFVELVCDSIEDLQDLC